MKTQYFTATTLDGFIADPNDSLDWLFPLGDIGDTSYETFIRDVGALVMGSTTYEWVLGHLAETNAKWPYEQPAWVLTKRTLSTPPDADVRFARGGVAALHREMAEVAAGKNIWVVGGGDVAGQFYDAGLLDEIHVQIGSVTLGAGKPLLPRKITSPSMQLVSARKIGSGFAELVYLVPRPAQ